MNSRKYLWPGGFTEWTTLSAVLRRAVRFEASNTQLLASYAKRIYFPDIKVERLRG